MANYVGISIWTLLAICVSVLSVRFVNGPSSKSELESAHDLAIAHEGESNVCGRNSKNVYVYDAKTGVGAAALLLATVLAAVVAARTAVSVVAYIELGVSYAAVLSAALIDGKLRRIPNVIPLALVIFRVLCFAYEYFFVDEALGYLTSALLGGFLCFVILTIAGRVSRNGVGAGDVKLVAAMGLMCGVYFIIYVLMFSLAICAIAAAVMVLLKKREKNDSLPFAPYLYVGFVCSLFIGLL